MTATGLLGRSVELVELRRALLAPECRLLTLTGPPGVGKTSLASCLATELRSRFPDGAVTLDLIGCDSAEAAATLLAARLGLPPAAAGSVVDRIVGYLQEQVVLVVLDSCEAVPDLAPLLGPVLARTRRTKVLATSQHRLRVAMERQYAVPPLAVPTPERDWAEDLAKVAEIPAMSMLLASTARTRPGFGVDADNVRPLVAICQDLEGLPLALEVAAARLGEFRPAELVVRLRNRRRLLDTRLAPTGRHQSLRTAIAWSHDLLTADERLVFRRVSVFPASWSLSAAEAVVRDPAVDVVAAITTLVERSLVRCTSSPDGAEAFDQLDTLRRFGAEQLEAAAEVDVVRQRFRAYWAQVAAEAEAAMGTPDEPFVLRWTADELTTLSRALSDSVASDDLTAALPLASAMGWAWYTHGNVHEGGLVIDLVTDVLTEASRPPSSDDFGGAVLVAGILCWARGDLGGASRLLERARDLADASGVRRRSAVANAFLGHVARASGNPALARHLHTRAQAAFRELANARGLAWASHDLALVALQQGRTADAARLFAETLPEFEGDAWASAWTWCGLAEVAVRNGDPLEASRRLVDALEVFVQSGDVPRASHCAGLLGEIAHGLGRSDVAAQLGAGLEPDRVLDLAREIVEAAGAPRSPLTLRQREVAALVATGATNRQIARELGISDKTVELHLSQIMARLGVVNRAQVATHAALTGLDRAT